MTIDEAKRLLLQQLNNNPLSYTNEEMVLLEKLTVVKSYGWIFFYNTRRFVETGDILHALGGNGPVVVEQMTGRITYLGSGDPPNEAVAEFEAKNGLSVDGS